MHIRRIILQFALLVPLMIIATGIALRSTHTDTTPPIPSVTKLDSQNYSPWAHLYPDEQYLEKDRQLVAAIKAYKEVPRTSSEYTNAQQWIVFIQEKRRLNRPKQTPHGSNREDVCMETIRQAKDAVVISKKFELADPRCEEFIDKYERLYEIKFQADTKK